MKQWSTDVVLLTDGNSQIPRELEALKRHQIAVHSEQIAALEGTDDGALQFIRLQGGKGIPDSGAASKCRWESWRGSLDLLRESVRAVRTCLAQSLMRSQPARVAVRTFFEQARLQYFCDEIE